MDRAILTYFKDPGHFLRKNSLTMYYFPKYFHISAFPSMFSQHHRGNVNLNLNFLSKIAILLPVAFIVDSQVKHLLFLIACSRKRFSTKFCVHFHDEKLPAQNSYDAFAIILGDCDIFSRFLNLTAPSL